MGKQVNKRKAPSMPDAREQASLPPDQSVGYTVREVHRAFMRSLEARLSRHGITPGMWWFLRLLWIEDGLSQAELSDRLNVMGPTTVRAMDRLERFGLITREADEQDKRKVIIRLTERGRDLERELMPYALDVNRVGTKNLTDVEAQILRTLLQRVLASLNEDHSAGSDRRSA